MIELDGLVSGWQRVLEVLIYYVHQMSVSLNLIVSVKSGGIEKKLIVKLFLVSFNSLFHREFFG
ncbi:hypothetical protein HYN46_04055 [Aquirhabdus parva]|uniref:Uncharacterized protein n=1 Tax=Aquirhabdus parva TaxID=2283318 RepID=A0A345P492_9GAMM|nr:hypothetical protein HYN46_04055 [Aquirhabdus parva]